jgi:uncharacterized membrane protein YfcA
MTADLFTPPVLIVLAIALTGGVVRGVTGFGGSLVMTPPFALMFGPQFAVPVVLLLEGFVAAPMLHEAARSVNWRVMAPISLAACVMVPAGGYLLVTADPQMLRRAIAFTVIVFSLLLLAGYRYAGSRGTGASLALGVLSGTMLGATGIGGPPVILYLMSGPDPARVVRANLVLYVTVISVAGLVMLWTRGLLNTDSVLFTLLLAPFFYGGVIVGKRLFSRFSEQRFRQFTLVLMLLSATGILLA